MKIRFLTDKPIAYLPNIKSLVITDIHLGIEHELYQDGIVIPPQADTFFRYLKQAVQATGAKKIIILGDIKHEVPGMSFRELKEIPRFFSNLSKISSIIVTKGNHDDQIEKLLLPNVKIYGSKGFKLKEYGFFHGHAWPSKSLLACDWLFMGHLQPAVEFRDIFGYKLIERVWVKCKLNKKFVRKKYKIKPIGELNLIITPSFNKLSGYLVLNRKKATGPLIQSKIINLEKCKLFLLDGTYLGELKSITKYSN